MSQASNGSTGSTPKIPRSLPDWFYNMNDGDVDRMIWREVILKERVARRHQRKASLRNKIKAAIVGLLLLGSTASAAEVYQVNQPLSPYIYILAYPPPGGEYCWGSTNVMYVVVPSVVAGDVLDTKAVVGVTIPWAAAAIAAMAIHIEPWTGAIPDNYHMPCNEHWTGQDVITPAPTPYVMLRSDEAWTATQDYPNGVLVLVRAYGGSALGAGVFVIMNVSGTSTARLTVVRYPR